MVASNAGVQNNSLRALAVYRAVTPQTILSTRMPLKGTWHLNFLFLINTEELVTLLLPWDLVFTFYISMQLCLSLTESVTS